MKSVNLNFLEPSGPLQACNGIHLTLLYYLLQTHGPIGRSPAEIVSSNPTRACTLVSCEFTVEGLHHEALY